MTTPAPEQSGPLEVLNVSPDAASESSSSGAPMKTTSKGTLSPVNPTTLDPRETSELLKRMQGLIDQKSGPWAQFMGGVQDALAYAAPQMSGQQALALQYRANQKAQEMQDVYNMQSNMATLRSAQTQQQNLNRALDQELYGTSGGVEGAPPAGGAQGARGTAGLYANLPPDVQDDVNFWMRQGRGDKVAEILGKYRSTSGQEYLKRVNRAETYKQEKYDVPNVGGVMMNMDQYQEWQNTGYLPDGKYAPPRGFKPQAQTTGLQTAAQGAPDLYRAEGVARDIGLPITSGYRSAEKQAEIEANKKPDQLVAKPGHSQHQFGNAVDVQWNKLTIPQQRAALQYFDQPFPEKDPGHLVLKDAPKVNAPVKVAANAPTPLPTQAPQAGAQVPPPAAAPATEPPPVRRQGQPIEAYEAEMEDWRNRTKLKGEVESKSSSKMREDAGAYMGGIVNTADKVNSTIEYAKTIAKHAKENPDAFGYGHQARNLPLALGANIPVFGDVVSTTVGARTGMGDVRSDVDSSAAQLGISYAKEEFPTGSGARMGVGLANMATLAKGVGTQYPAKTNYVNARKLEITAELIRDQADAWTNYSNAEKARGNQNPDPYAFMQSKTNKDLQRNWDQKFAEIRKEADTIFPGTQTKKAPQNVTVTGTATTEGGRPPLSSFGK